MKRRRHITRARLTKAQQYDLEQQIAKVVVDEFRRAVKTGLSQLCITIDPFVDGTGANVTANVDPSCRSWEVTAR